jgi:transcriptional regulator with XRE-family HTH domain
VATLGDFGCELTAVRERAGLTVRAVARAAGVPVSTAGDYFSGRHLPLQSQPGVLEAILRACGVADPASLKEWDSARARVRRRPGRRSLKVRPPYRGLARFEPQDAPWFFGREEIAGSLVDLVSASWAPAGPDGAAEQATGGATGVPLAVVGPSGSGKSSLLRAGLIPRLAGAAAPAGLAGAINVGAGRLVALFTPAARPVADLAAALGEAGAGAPGGEELEARLRADPSRAAEIAGLSRESGLVVVVDQFEAVFTECCDEQERQLFITAICGLARWFAVVLALRADFYDHALRYPELAAALQQRQVVLPPMSRDQVRRVICEPARLDGLDVEDGLVELLLRDLAPESAAGTRRVLRMRWGPCRCCLMRCSSPGSIAEQDGSPWPVTWPAAGSGKPSPAPPKRSTPPWTRMSRRWRGGCSYGWCKSLMRYR